MAAAPVSGWQLVAGLAAAVAAISAIDKMLSDQMEQRITTLRTEVRAQDTEHDRRLASLESWRNAGCK